jgi:hypothetical protein
MIFRKESADNNFKPEIPPRMDEALESLNKSPRGTHCLVVYPDLITLRTMYTHYTRIQLEKNEIVLILPYYETTDMVRLFLSGINVYGDNNNNNPFGYSGIEVGKYEKEGSLMIMDSLKAYFPSEEQGSFNNKTKGGLNLISFIDILLKHAKRRRKEGVTVLSDLGSFYHNSHNHSNQKLIEYEKSIPKKYEDMSLKGFCLYHQNDFERHFSQEQQGQLLECHNRSIVLTS